MQQSLNYTIDNLPTATNAVSGSIEDYSIILENHGLEYERNGYHLQVGKITKVQGWIIHISTVRNQIPELLYAIIPTLIYENIPFKIVQDYETARNVLDGNVGNSQVGKVISIYPGNDLYLENLAKELINITKKFKGPAALTDAHLGACVYTRYGSFNPIIVSDAAGNEEKYIYDQEGELVRDIYHIPFKMPQKIKWPFGNLTNQSVSKERKILNQIYRPIINLKSDPRGNVMKALYLNKIFDIRWCIIKQAKKNMWCDEFDRDITNRLIWQKELHEKLEDVINLPRILDYFLIDEDSYLVMKYIKGPSLYERLAEINKDCKIWFDWTVQDRLLILDYLLQMIDVLKNLHQLGYVHRDVTPVNFLVNKKNQLVLIDIELAYSTLQENKYPPFILGTNGFMSPEQQEVKTPTVKEDIYGLGATMITLLAGVSPYMFSPQETEVLQNTINFFIHDIPLSKTIADCLNSNPSKRPNLTSIQTGIHQYIERSKTNSDVREKTAIDNIKLERTIQQAIRGLVAPSTLMANDLWLSKTPSKNVIPGKPEREYAKAGGMREGMAGVLYFISSAKKAGFNVDACEKSYYQGWEYLADNYLQFLPDIPPGFYGGASGLACALASGIASGLLEDNEQNRTDIKQCLSVSSSGFDFASGITGQGIAAFQCEAYLEQNEFQSLLQNYIDVLLKAQHKKGFWIKARNISEKSVNTSGFTYDNGAITWFLLDYISKFNHPNAKNAAINSLQHIGTRANAAKKLIRKYGFRKINGDAQTWDAVQGIILTCLKAYETFSDPSYKKIAEEILYMFSSRIVHDNLTQETGLAGLGEIYLEAYRVLKNEEWMKRAEWIIALFIQIKQMDADGSCYWLANNSIFPTADFLVGNSGIIHLLIRYQNKEIGYRLLK